MSEELEKTTSPEEIALRDDLREMRSKIETLVAELYTAEDELERLHEASDRFRSLESACASLEQLDDTDAGRLFWSGLIPDEGPGEGGLAHLRRVRDQIAEFDKELDAAEQQRQRLLENIELHEMDADQIAGFILDAERDASLRENEWTVEREDVQLRRRIALMPWLHGGEDDRRFRKTLAASLAIALLLGLLLPLIDIPIPERWEILEEQDRLTQLIREELPPPPPPAPEQTLVAESEPEATEPVEESEVAAEEIVPESAPAAKPAEKPSTASKGILAFREKFSALAKTEDVDRLGANARISNPGQVADGLPQRSMVVSQASSSSGGINVSSLSRDTGGSGGTMSGVAVTQATSTIGSGNGNGNGSGRPLSGGGPGLGRTDEEIQIVFDRHKAALYRLYNRELRKNPTLKGQIVLRLTIEPDGSVSLCEVKSSNMKAPKLADQVVRRVRTFDFGAKDGIAAVTIVYPIDFLPAT